MVVLNYCRVWGGRAWRFLASSRCTVFILLVLAMALVFGSWLELVQGREHAQWHVYGAGWFAALLGLLGVNQLAVWAGRMAGRRERCGGWPVGESLASAGLLLLLLGAAQAYVWGVQGTVSLPRGQEKETDVFRDPSRSVITLVHSTPRGKVSTEIVAALGPADWDAGRELDLGASHGVSVRMVKYVRHAVHYCEWVADEHSYQGPALLLRLQNARDDEVATQWLAAAPSGGEAILGPTGYQLWPLPVTTMLEDFERPPVESLGTFGVLSMHYQGRMYRVPIDGAVGTQLPVGETGVAVEVVHYYPDARPSPQGGFYSRSERPGNPLLELKVHLRDGQTMTAWAFAKRPLLTMEGVTGEVCPVRFWYHHGAVTPTPGADFAQMPDGMLYCRTTVHDYRTPVRRVQVGDTVPLGSQFNLRVLQYLPHARQDMGFRSVAVSQGAGDRNEAAALLELCYDGTCQQIWLQRGDPEYRFASVLTSQGRVMLSFDYRKLPLGYTLRACPQRGVLSDGDKPATAVSNIELVDEEGRVLRRQTLTASQPLQAGLYRLCPMTKVNPQRSDDSQVWAVTYDPGRIAKYAGCGLILIGLSIMLWRRVSLFCRLAWSAEAGEVSGEQTDRLEPSITQGRVLVPSPLGRQRARSPSRSQTP